MTSKRGSMLRRHVTWILHN